MPPNRNIVVSGLIKARVQFFQNQKKSKKESGKDERKGDVWPQEPQPRKFLTCWPRMTVSLRACCLPQTPSSTCAWERTTLSALIRSLKCSTWYRNPALKLQCLQKSTAKAWSIWRVCSPKRGELWRLKGWVDLANLLELWELLPWQQPLVLIRHKFLNSSTIYWPRRH